MNNIFILISTMDDRIINLKNIIDVYNTGIVYVVSHQITMALAEETKIYIDTLSMREDIIYHTLKGKGVARNRNNTLNFIKPSSLCLILDDDVLLCKDVFRLVGESFEKNPLADFISFKILDLEGNDYKPYPKEKQWHTLRTLSGIGTTEIAFRSDLVLHHDLKFDERFGPGAEKYPLGEDFIFAMDLYHAKTKMLFLPIPIVKHPLSSTGGSLDEKVIFARGAVFARVFGRKAYLLNIFFSYKHRGMYQKHYSVFEYLKLLFVGSYDFLTQEKNK